jgi:NAD(P)-dependent dehydrogenase (short-subunit alcohol dehydrogenase family)
MATVLIIGASRGIGFEFARVHAARGDQVIATCRDDAAAERLNALGVRVERLEVTDAAAAKAFADRMPTLDRVVVNAGVFGPRDATPATVDSATWLGVFEVNVVAPLRLAALLADKVTGSMAFLSSRMGSIAMSGGGSAIYRTSKAALNAGIKALQVERGAKQPILLALHPGWVRTDMGGAGADIDVAQSVAGMVAVIDSARSDASGGFFNYTGEVIPW